MALKLSTFKPSPPAIVFLVLMGISAAVYMAAMTTAAAVASPALFLAVGLMLVWYVFAALLGIYLLNRLNSQKETGYKVAAWLLAILVMPGLASLGAMLISMTVGAAVVF